MLIQANVIIARAGADSDILICDFKEWKNFLNFELLFHELFFFIE